jgi:hypothetical protein
MTEVERRIRVRSLLPVQLDYDPFQDAESMKRLLHDLTLWVLSGRLFHRQASTVRGLIQQWIRVDEHSRLDEIDERLRKMEAERGVKA